MVLDSDERKLFRELIETLRNSDADNIALHEQIVTAMAELLNRINNSPHKILLSLDNIDKKIDNTDKNLAALSKCVENREKATWKFYAIIGTVFTLGLLLLAELTYLINALQNFKLPTP